MNMPVVKKNLIGAAEDVKTELSNVEKLTGEKADLATMWETYLKKVLKNMDAHGKKWVKARIDDSLEKTRKTIPQLRKNISALKTKEKDSAHNKKQNVKRKDLDKKLKQAKAALVTAEQKEEADEKKKDAEILKYQKAKTKVLKDSLRPVKEQAMEDHEKAKKATEAAMMAVGTLERQILELTSAGLGMVMHRMSTDVKILRQLEKRMAALSMPTI